MTAQRYSLQLDDAEGYLNSTLMATLPGSRMGLGDGVESGFLGGAAGTLMSGSSDYSGTLVDTSEWANCGGDREWRRKTSEGSFTGDLTLDWFLHRNTEVDDVNGGADWTNVRMRAS